MSSLTHGEIGMTKQESKNPAIRRPVERPAVLAAWVLRICRPAHETQGASTAGRSEHLSTPGIRFVIRHLNIRH